MYRAYKTSNLSFDNSVSDSQDEYLTQARDFHQLLESASSLGKLDGTAIREKWFPQQTEAQVFISHSHKDKEKAVKLSNWLKSQLGITAFIDSAVWLYADDLLRDIDNYHCYDRVNKTYSYEKRNGTTAHVHMMLATALALMLDSCECAFFIDTLNSVSKEQAVAKTGSAWIMYEVTLMGLIRPKKPIRPENFSGKILNEVQKKANASLQIEYELDLSLLPILSNRDLKKWNSDCQIERGADALDILYETHS